MVDFIDRQRPDSGIEPICNELPIAPSTHYAAKAYQVDEEPLALCVPNKNGLSRRNERDIGASYMKRREPGLGFPFGP